MEEASRYQGLLGINLFKMTGDQIGQAKKPLFKPSTLPTFCLYNTDKEDTPLVLQYAEDYLQFIHKGKKEYILFNVCSCDTIISEEISNGEGEEALFSDFIKYLHKETPTELVKIFDKLGYSNFFNEIPTTRYFIVECNWWKSWTDCGYEYDGDVGLVGYLDNNLQKVMVRGVDG